MAEIRYQDRLNKLYQKDCRDMSELSDGSVHCCITSPPYWGLRKYSGVPDLVFDGDPNCQHKWVDNSFVRNNDKTAGPIQRGNKGSVGRDEPIINAFCLKCSAWSGQLGQEPTPELYIKHIVDIFREVKRVLRSDGCAFVNIGDSYAANYRGGAIPNEWHKAKRSRAEVDFMGQKAPLHPYKPQDKCLIPFRLAIALQEDGWWVRQDIIWQKNNPMPESVSSPGWVKHRVKVSNKKPNKVIGGVEHWNSGGKNLRETEWQDCPGCEKCLPNDGLVLRHGSWRPTESHEYILMLTKSNDYYCDGEAVREVDHPDSRKQTIRRQTNRYSGELLNPFEDQEHERWTGSRNLRSVWTFSTQSYAGAHYATFPEKLPELCIKAGTSEYGVCAECGKPWARILKTDYDVRAIRAPTEKQFESVGGSRPNMPFMGDAITQTLGWRATCKCKTDKVVGATVLDPFCGTGTTLYVASKLGRQAIGYELSEDYAKLTIERLKQQVMM